MVISHLHTTHRKFIFAIVAALLPLQVSSLILQQRQQLRRRSGVNVALTSAIHHDGPSCTSLINMDTHFTVEVNVGTPPQRFELVADTGSDSVIVQSCACQHISPQCVESEDCFVGTNKSSTFVPPPPNHKLRVLSFGSGDIVVAVATDVVRLGRERATMDKGLMLMVNRALDVTGNFEGILGLGVPSWVEKAERPPKIAGADPANQLPVNGKDPLKRKAKDNETGEIMEPMPRLLEEAGVKSFSICMKANQPGVLRMRPPDAPKMLKNVGYHHWALDFQGISAGSSNNPVVICDKKKIGQDLACAGIPDSGTTLLMGPKKQLDDVFAELCNRWVRCQDEVASYGSRPEKAFLDLVHRCSEWSHEVGISEIPSVFLHLGGADGDTQVLELAAWSYIVHSQTMLGETVCQALFGEWEYQTVLHGPVWILGTPLFYEYEVVFSSDPPSIGFRDEDCGYCDEDYYDMSNTTGFHVNRQRNPRLMRRPPRMPSVDRSLPL